MATSQGKTDRPNPETMGRTDLDAEVRQLREDVAKLSEQIAQLGKHSYGTARRAAGEGVEQLRAKGEAAVEGLRENVREAEDQLVAHVHEKPITSLAVAAAVGYFFALLSRR